MAGLFQELEGETCILVSQGVFIECRVFTRNQGELFAKLGRGFVRLYANGTTSQSKARLDTLTVYPLHKDSFGKLYNAAGDKTKLHVGHNFAPIDTGTS
jgi:hypothetical protein